jgi:hypothetical protein
MLANRAHTPVRGYFELRRKAPHLLPAMAWLMACAIHNHDTNGTPVPFGVLKRILRLDL